MNVGGVNIFKGFLILYTHLYIANNNKENSLLCCQCALCSFSLNFLCFWSFVLCLFSSIWIDQTVKIFSHIIARHRWFCLTSRSLTTVICRTSAILWSPAFCSLVSLIFSIAIFVFYFIGFCSDLYYLF